MALELVALQFVWMKPAFVRAIALIALVSASTLATGATPFDSPQNAATADSGTIRVHLLGHAIGRERYGTREDGGALVMTDSFSFTDRGGRIELATTFRYTPAFEAQYLRATGKTYRFVNVDAEVEVRNSRVMVRNLGDSTNVAEPKSFFALPGYAPLQLQALLVRYWERHGRPERIVIAPGDSTAVVHIESLGDARLDFSATSRLSFKRYSIDGVAWGNEILYLDSDSRFAAIVTRANLLPLEGIREDLATRYPSMLAAISADAARAEIELGNRTMKAIAPVADKEFALVGARVITGEQQPPLEDGAIVVRDGRIAAVGPRGKVQIPRGARTIDVQGKTIIPGLWDMHAHVALPEWGPAYLGVGVTTARDMGGEKTFLVAFRDALRDTRVLGPRLLLAGLVDGAGAEAFGTVYAETPAEARAVVNDYHAAGFQQMKLYTQLKADVAGAVIRRAHELGMTVTGHVPRSLTLASYIDSGANNIAHMPLRGDPSSEAVKQQIRTFVEKNFVVDPTISWNELLGRSMQTPLASFQPGFAEAPWPLRASYGSVRNTGDSATINRGVRSQLALIKALHDGGVRIVAGTDYGLPGFSLLRELELYVAAGLSPLDAIRSASAVPADVMGLSNDAGTIAIGKRADLVVLDANPLADISNIRKGKWVVTNGRMFDMTALRRAVHFQVR